jgi:hypothetical protein
MAGSPEYSYLSFPQKQLPVVDIVADGVVFVLMGMSCQGSLNLNSWKGFSVFSRSVQLMKKEELSELALFHSHFCPGHGSIENSAPLRYETDTRDLFQEELFGDTKGRNASNQGHAADRVLLKAFGLF